MSKKDDKFIKCSNNPDLLQDIVENIPIQNNLIVSKSFHLQVYHKWKPRPNAYNIFHLCYIREGKGSYHINGQEVEISPGKIILMSDGVTHRTQHDYSNPLSITTLFFEIRNNQSGDLIKAATPFYMVLEDNQEGKIYKCVEAVHNSFTSTKSQVNTNHSTILMADTLFHIINLIKGENSNIDRELDSRIVKSLKYMYDNPLSRTSLAELARIAGLTPDYFSRLFKQIMGLSPKKYQVDLRLKKAREIIEGSDARIAEVADQLGYTDPYIFSKQFKKKFGYSPGSIRKQP